LSEVLAVAGEDGFTTEDTENTEEEERRYWPQITADQDG
jgi:hypothetical protein